MNNNIKLSGGVAIIENEGKHFLIQQSKNKKLSGQWRHPGGTLEQGESVEQGLKREIMEELGVEIELENNEPLMIAEHDFIKGFYFGFFKVKAKSLDFKIDDYEIDQSGWFTPDEARKLNLMGATKNFYNKFN